MPDLSRRQLIVAGSAATLAAGLPSFAQSSNRKVGWAILGLGGYALNQILPNMQYCVHSAPVALISGTPDKAKETAKKYNIAESMIFNYQNMDRIKDVPEIEVVYVITPPGTHHEFTMRSLLAGKHVCCEKPMTGDLKEAEEMVATATRVKRRLGMGYRCHFEPHNLWAMEAVKERKFGAIRTVRSEHAFTLGWRGWHSDRKLGGYGAIGEIGVYAIQALCYGAGEDPIEIIGTRDKTDNPLVKEVEDVNHFNLRFPSGAQGIGATGYSFNANNFRIYGNRGRLDAEPGTGYSGHRFLFNGQPITVTPANQWAQQMDHLSECVKDEQKTLITPGEMGLRDIRIIDAILRSADNRGAPIKL